MPLLQMDTYISPTVNSGSTDEMSAEERQYLDDLAGRMALPAATAEAISSWVRDYETLLKRLDKLISVPPAC